MTINELAKMVADDFKATMKEEGFESFNEMAKCYWWDAADIRGEISYLAESIVNKDYDDYVKANGTCSGYAMVVIYDDCSLSGWCDGKYKDMSYRDFKKLVLSNLR